MSLICDPITLRINLHLATNSSGLQDLVPVVKTFWASEESKTLKPGDKVVPPAELPFPVDVTTDVPAPFMFADFLAEHAKELEGGASLNLFGDDHPDTEFSVLVESGPATAPARSVR